MTLADIARNAAVAAVGALCNGGDIRFETAANGEVATCAFNATAFGSPSAGVITAATITDDTDAAGGTIDHAKLRSSAAATVATLTCTAVGGGGDLELTSLVIGAGDTVTVSSLTMTQPAS